MPRFETGAVTPTHAAYYWRGFAAQLELWEATMINLNANKYLILRPILNLSK